MRILSVQDVVAALERPAKGHRRVELLQLRLELLVDQKQRLQRAVDIAIAVRHDLVDGRFDRSETHRKPSNSPRDKSLTPDQCSCGLRGLAAASNGCPRQMAKVRWPDVVI